MSLLLAVLLLPPTNCQTGEPGLVGQTKTARWIEAEGVRDGEWLGWAASGPRRAAAPIHGPWLALEFSVATVEPAPDAWVLTLAAGGTLRGEPGPDLPDAGLPTWRLALSGRPQLPFDPLWLRSQGRGFAPTLPSGADQDQLCLRRPGGTLDCQRGWLLDWRAAGAVFGSTSGERTYPWSEVDSLCVLDEALELPGDAVWLFLADGSTLAGTILSQEPGVDGGAWMIELPWGARARLPEEAVTRIRRRAGVEEWARRDWIVGEQPAGEALDWSPKFHRSVEGHPLRLGGRTWPDGIGVKAPSELSRRTPGAGTLLLTVGADARVAEFRQPQPVVFRVFLDGAELAATAPLGVARGPQTLLVQVPRAGMLRLRAETEGAAHHGAHGDWCDLLWLPGE